LLNLKKSKAELKLLNSKGFLGNTTKTNFTEIRRSLFKILKEDINKLKGFKTGEREFLFSH
jgi:hypothetical protein